MTRLFPASISACIPSPFREDFPEESLPHCAHEEQRPQLVQPKSKAAASSFPMFFLPPYYEHSCQSQNTDAAVLPHGQAPPVQSLITAGSRLYGSSNCLDPRTCLGIKIYDFAVYADVEQLRRATSTHHQQLLQQLQQHQQQSPNLSSPLSQESGGTENGEASIQGESTQHFLTPWDHWLGASKGLLQGMGSACSWLGSGMLGTVDWGTDSGMDEPCDHRPGDEDNGQAAGTTRRERRQQRRQQKQQQRQLQRGLNWERKMAKRQERKEGRERRFVQQNVLSSGSASVGGLAVEVLMKDPSLPVSIVLRATRDLPVHLLQQEMGRVLHKRFLKAGGSEGSPELPKLLECFSSHRLPAQCCSSSSSSGGSSSKRAAEQSDRPASTPSARSPCRTSPPPPLPLPLAPSSPPQPSTSPLPPPAAVQDMAVKQGSMLVFSRDQWGCLTATALTSGSCDITPTADSSSSSSSLFGSSTTLFGSNGSSSSGSSSGADAQGGPAVEPACAQPVLKGSCWGGEGGVGLLEQPLQCAPLCEALLDMYLGSQPACKKAKAAAESSLSHLLASWAQPQHLQQQQQQQQACKGCAPRTPPVYQPSRTSGHVIQCQDSADAGTCVVCVQ